MTFLEKNDFDKKQLLEIKKGKKHGLSKRKILLYANKAFDNFQMKLIRKALENGLSFKKTRVIANPDLDFYQMLEVSEALINGLPLDFVSKYASGDFDFNQLKEIFKGFERKDSPIRQLYGFGYRRRRCRSVCLRPSIQRLARCKRSAVRQTRARLAHRFTVPAQK